MSDDSAPKGIPDSRFIEAVNNGAQTTKEIADTVGVTRQGADYRLRQLRDDDVVTAEKVGNTLLWSVKDD